MSEGRVERRLAAILAVDVAGYSRLMGSDEEGTLAALRAVRREIGDPKIREHRGRIVKTPTPRPGRFPPLADSRRSRPRPTIEHQLSLACCTHARQRRTIPGSGR